jgi:hypothetical protein
MVKSAAARKFVEECCGELIGRDIAATIETL